METELLEAKQSANQHLITIHVNNQPVLIRGPKANGLQIKQAAIAAHVAIQSNFQLLEELGGGRTKVIADTDEIRISEKSRFAAIAPDDNS